MKKVAVLAVVVLTLCIGHTVPILAGQRTTLKPGGSSSDVRLIKKPFKMKSVAADRSNLVLTQPTGIIDTLRAYTGIGGINFGFDNMDSMLIWFQPTAACSLLAIRFYVLDWEGNMLLDIWDGSRYDGHITTQDSTDANGWIGTNVPVISPGPVMGPRYTPLGWNATDPEHHYWGPFPFTVTQSHADSWVELPASYGIQGEVDLGREPFYVSAVFYKKDGWGFLCDDPDYLPYSFFKFYAQCCGPDETHDGWFIRSFSPWIETIVCYYENTPPDISGTTVQNDTYGPGPFPIQTEITDQDAENPASAGVASAYLVYTLNTVTDSTAMDGPFEGGTFTGTIPALDLWDTVTYHISACDPPGLCSRSQTHTFSRIEPDHKTADLLLINDGMQVDSLYTYLLDNLVLDEEGNLYEYEYWDVAAHNGIDASILDRGWGTIIVAGWGCRNTMPGGEYSPQDLLISFLEVQTFSSPDTHNILYIDQDYFCVHEEEYGCAWDQEMSPGEFMYDYFGVAFAISDNHGADDGDYDSVAVGIEGDPITAEFVDAPINFRPDALTDTPERWNWPDWIESEAQGAARLFTYQDNRFGAGTRYNGGHFKTVYIPWQLDFAVDTLESGDIVPRAGVARLIQNVLWWFGTKNHTLGTNPSGDSHTIPGKFVLYQNSPNPFNSTTEIRYRIPDSRYHVHTTLKICNILGQELKTLVNEPQDPGSYMVSWDGRADSGEEVSSGIYFCRLEVTDAVRVRQSHNSSVITRRMILLR
ncbi:MAG: hypothetical protein JSV84_14585 [Gemmatimonadota bacterium]|nr:MAG: hypothetical protein JSV84_14585 [Gemmatimonadota bacterium]